MYEELQVFGTDRWLWHILMHGETGLRHTSEIIHDYQFMSTRLRPPHVGFPRFGRGDLSPVEEPIEAIHVVADGHGKHDALEAHQGDDGSFLPVHDVVLAVDGRLDQGRRSA